MCGPSILLVEDDDIDTEAVRRALVRENITAPILRACNGEEALDVLKGRDANPCYLMLVDINLPRMNGFTFLENLRREKAARNSVVFVLTTSDLEEDRRHAYELNVAGYFLKENLAEFSQMLSKYIKANRCPYQYT